MFYQQIKTACVVEFSPPLYIHVFHIEKIILKRFLKRFKNICIQ